MKNDSIVIHHGHKCWKPGTYVKLREDKKGTFAMSDKWSNTYKVVKSSIQPYPVVINETDNSLYALLTWFELAMPDIYADD